MKSNEISLCITASTLLLITFCIVAITATFTEKSVREPVQHLSSGSKGETNRTFVHGSTDNLENAAHKPEPKTTSLASSNRRLQNRPVNPKTNTRPSNDRIMRSDIKDLLQPIESNGRVYLENTTGIEICENENEDEGGIETIE